MAVFIITLVALTLYCSPLFKGSFISSTSDLSRASVIKVYTFPPLYYCYVTKDCGKYKGWFLPGGDFREQALCCMFCFKLPIYRNWSQ